MSELQIRSLVGVAALDSYSDTEHIETVAHCRSWDGPGGELSYSLDSHLVSGRQIRSVVAVAGTLS